MKKHIRPAQEEMHGNIYTIIFMIVWYGIIFRTVIVNGFQANLLIFLVGGLLPLLAVARETQRALFYRREHQRAIQGGRMQRGKITGYSRKAVASEGKNGRSRYRTYYFLQVEIYNSDNGAVSQFLSQAYSKPIHKYLGGSSVTVYTDESGWHRYLDDFQWKERRSDPDIFNSSREWDGSGGLNTAIRVIAVVVLILMFLFMVLEL